MPQPLQLTSDIHKHKAPLKEVQKTASKKSVGDKVSNLSNSKMVLIIPGIIVLAIGGVIKVDANYNNNLQECERLKKDYSQFASGLAENCGITYKKTLQEDNLIENIELDFKQKIVDQEANLQNYKQRINNLIAQVNGLGLEYQHITNPVDNYEEKLNQYKTQEKNLVQLINSKQNEIHKSLKEYEYLLTTFTDYNLAPELESLEAYTSSTQEKQNINYIQLQRNLTNLKSKIYNNLKSDKIITDISENEFFSVKYQSASEFVNLGNQITGSKKKLNLS